MSPLDIRDHILPSSRASAPTTSLPRRFESASPPFQYALSATSTHISYCFKLKTSNAESARLQLKTFKQMIPMAVPRSFWRKNRGPSQRHPRRICTRSPEQPELEAPPFCARAAEGRLGRRFLQKILFRQQARVPMQTLCVCVSGCITVDLVSCNHPVIIHSSSSTDI
jgi:hypothetical protein